MLALLAVLLAAAGPGAAPPPGAKPVVAIDCPADADAVLTEATFRLRAELAAAGYDSRTVTCDVDPKAGPADCPRDETLASISLARADGVTSIFVSSKLKSGLELRRQVRVRGDDGGADATLLAVRAVELLRDLQVTVATAAAVDSEDPRPLEPFAQPPPPGPPRWQLVAGSTTLMIPWTHRSTFDPAFGALIGIGRRYGQRVLAIVQAAGPFATSLPVAQQAGTLALADRPLYQAITGLSVRVGRLSAVEGWFGSAFAGASYMHLDLSASGLNGPGHTLSPMVGLGLGYTSRVTKSFSVTAELDLKDTDDIQVKAGDEHAPVLLTESGYIWMALNLTATVPLF